LPATGGTLVLFIRVKRGSGLSFAGRDRAGTDWPGDGLGHCLLMGAAVGAVAASRSGTASALINVARMAGATIGVAILGAVFAKAHRGGEGFRVAMLVGGVVQITCAAVAWKTTRPT
jgi:MFS transporter, DHA2 family, methylenomycin A resistance protein